MESRHVSAVIAAEPDVVYAFAADPENLPRWASGLAQAEVALEGDLLIVDSPMGRVTVCFAPPNEYGVLDHDVTLPAGAVVSNPLRVVAHPHGAEVVFTVRRLDLTAEEFDRDCATVARDLDRLRELVERGE